MVNATAKPKLGEGSTPGPWKPGPSRTFETQSGQFYLSYGQDRFKNPLFKNFCELDANARLISKAPLLIEARDVLELLVDCFDNGMGQFQMGMGMKEARALLAKLDAE